MTEIQDSNQLLKFACEDLRGIQSIILTVNDHPEYANAHEALVVIDRALCSIIGDMQEAIGRIDKALKQEERTDVDREGRNTDVF